jgi:hypothetical protein
MVLEDTNKGNPVKDLLDEIADHGIQLNPFQIYSSQSLPVACNQ